MQEDGKGRMSEAMEPRFEHAAAEDAIYKQWEASGYFNPDKLPKRKGAGGTSGRAAKPFTFIMPPPNANGSLHLGHAVFVTLQDIMIRYARMQGRKALWVPGADHAGFETQVVFDKKLEKEGRNRFQMDREQLWQEIWNFTQENKKVMEGQLRKLGASCDWSREKFTLDPDIIKTVYETFELLYKDGLVYRDLRVVNWCPKHRTALSDLEVKYVEREDPLYYIKYGPLTLATVRPETKFGDTGLAVHPNDKRYKKYIDKEIEAKGVLGTVKFKVIGDEAVDPKFGTGVVKITPAHDALDFEIWQRHKDEVPGPKIVIDESGRLTGDVGDYKGLKVAEARAKVVEKMQEIGILEKVDAAYTHQVATCYKCNSTLEPLPKPQWFVKIKPLAEKAIKAAEQKKVVFHPDRSKKVYFHWLKNIRDWNISRQIIWGIRIPAWYCKGHGIEKIMGFAESIVPQVLDKGKRRTYRLRDHDINAGDKLVFENTQAKKTFGYGIFTRVEKTTVGAIKLPDQKHGGGYTTTQELIKAFKRHYPEKEVTTETEAWIYDFDFEQDVETIGCGATAISGTLIKKCPHCGSSTITQDPDVFDTWFSSGQWPFAALGYPKSKDYRTYYPTDVMETGYDILFFWVTRMMMLGLYRTGKVPFKHVYLHGLVRDKDRQKMSKSKGNVIDPLGVAELYGADALRMALTVGNTAGNDIIISEDKIRGYRNFTTKVWNIARFVMMNRPAGAAAAAGGHEERRARDKAPAPLSKIDNKYITDAEKVKARIAQHIEKFEFHLAAETAYHYMWHTFADKIIETAKPRLAGTNEKDKQAAYYALETILLESLKMLHPFMPFVTEAVWQKFRPGTLLMVEKW